MRPSRLLPAAICLLLHPAPLDAQIDPEPGTLIQDDDGALHDELRALRQELVDAIVEGDVEKQLQYAHPDIVVTWQHGETVTGHDGLREFLADIGARQGDVFKGYTQPPTPADLTVLHGGDVGVSYGTSVAHYEFAGQEFDLTNHWTATLVREGDGWKLAAYHVSANVLDNPLLNAAKAALYWAGGLGALVGLVVGLLIGAVLFRRKRAAAPA